MIDILVVGQSILERMSHQECQIINERRGVCGMQQERDKSGREDHLWDESTVTGIDKGSTQKRKATVSQEVERYVKRE